MALKVQDLLDDLDMQVETNRDLTLRLQELEAIERKVAELEILNA